MSTHQSSTTSTANALHTSAKRTEKPRKWVLATQGFLIRTDYAYRRGKIMLENDYNDSRELPTRVVRRCFVECRDIYPEVQTRVIRLPGETLYHHCIALAENTSERAAKLPPQEVIDQLKAKLTEMLDMEPRFGWYRVEA